MSEKNKINTVSIRLTVLGVFVIITGLTASIALGLHYYFSKNLARTAAENTCRSMSEKVGRQMDVLDNYSANLVDVLSNFHTLATFPDQQKESFALPLLGAAMKNNPSIYAVFVGYDNGNFFELINLESGKDFRKRFQATPQDSWVLVKITSLAGNRSKTSVYLDSAFKVRTERREDTDYDPRKRPWFAAALASDRMIKTPPYFFSLLKAPGITYAKNVKKGQRVVAVDISLAGLSEFLQRQMFIPDTQAFIFDTTGKILARASQTAARSLQKKSAIIKLTDEQKSFISAHPTIRASNEMDWPPFDFAVSGSPQGYSVDILNLLAEKTGLQIEYVNGFSWNELIAVAIDQKSPYTGGYCARVPVLSIMLAEAASSSADKPFSNFSFKTREEWREFRTAAWLHDCGKVTMPEYIGDKATKLETIYNRIHEVRMRFEVLLRDAEIDYWQGMARGEDKAVLSRTLSARQKEIEENFAFIAGCNVGGEFMDETQVDRMKKIAKETWERRLDDRLGLGHLELLRYPEKAPELPCREPLLADRPEHIIERPEPDPMSTPKAWCDMEVPEHLYNLGEIYNLCISRGTLTAEDRYKINEHIITTITMLETLPYPENMKRIPEYAGVHHETLIGTGYPRKLKADQIGIPGRIIAIADIFEALTASDRPYKKAKPLSESIRILSFMVKDNHLDADLFKLFLESEVYMKYAEEFLAPEQIDEVRIEDFIKDLT